MIRTLNYPSATLRSQSRPLSANSAASLVGHLMVFVGIASAIGLSSGLCGSVALEGAHRDNMAFSSRAAAAETAAESLRLDVERLKLPGEIDRWAKLNGFTRDEFVKAEAASTSTAENAVTKGAATGLASSSKTIVVPD